jgi:RNA polymerase sigma-70 factor (ECF subfamily)
MEVWIGQGASFAWGPPVDGHHAGRHRAGTLSRARFSRRASMPTTNPLDALMARVADGDTDAFSRLYDQTSAMVYGLARRVVRSEAMAEEVTQEVFLQVWRKSAEFDPARGAVKTWIATLAHRRAVDAVRRSQSSRDREAKVPEDPPAPDVAEAAIVTDEQERVRAALGALTDLQLQVIEMSYFGGLTYREVAERLDTPLATVKTRIRDGLMRMRAALGDDNG